MPSLYEFASVLSSTVHADPSCYSCQTLCSYQIEGSNIPLSRAVRSFYEVEECSSCVWSDACTASNISHWSSSISALERLLLAQQDDWVAFVCEFDLHDQLKDRVETGLVNVSTDLIPNDCTSPEVEHFLDLNFGGSPSVCDVRLPYPSCFDKLYEYHCATEEMSLYRMGASDDMIQIAWGGITTCPSIALTHLDCRGVLAHCEHAQGRYCLHKKCETREVVPGIVSCWPSRELYRQPCFGANEPEDCVERCTSGHDSHACNEKCAFECAENQWTI